ncbi:ribosomal protein S5 domain 2-like protein [Marasmius fiardii PR-910]|nr:ribosomal protein S5 domain 2-like protein [Marasmius fiardii PR-910]
MTSNLDNFIQRSRPLPEPIATSQEIRDRGSTFVATIYRAASLNEARARTNHLRNVVHSSKPASHEISAWRFMVLKNGRTGLGGSDDFHLESGSDDDGEQWAGGKVLRIMESQAVIDAIVIVSRWYGGILLGPDRFSHIKTCAHEVCQSFKKKEEFDECILALNTLDDTLTELRRELAELTANDKDEGQPFQSGKRPPTKPNYSAMTEVDLSKAKRLVLARENAVISLKKMIARKRGAGEDTPSK